MPWGHLQWIVSAAVVVAANIDLVKAGSSKMRGNLAMDMFRDDPGTTVLSLPPGVTSCQTCLNSAQEQGPRR